MRAASRGRAALTRPGGATQIDATANDVPEEIEGFPTLYYKKAGNKAHKIDPALIYQGARTRKAFVSFIKARLCRCLCRRPDTEPHRAQSQGVTLPESFQTEEVEAAPVGERLHARGSEPLSAGPA
jgi:hypothetical protein